jgi:hypothetical protein
VLGVDKPAFETILRELFGAIDKPLSESTIEGFWKGLAKMSLLEFSRCRDLLLDELSQVEAPKKFAVPDIWAAKKRLRSAPVVTDGQPPWKGDKWDEAGNWRLYAIVLRAALARSKISDAQMRAYVAFKNRWADLMRESAVGDEVPLDEQNDSWKSCMAMARAEFEQPSIAA